MFICFWSQIDQTNTTCISVFFGIDFPGQWSQWGIFVNREAFWKKTGVFCGTGMATVGVGREFQSLVQEIFDVYVDIGEFL